MTYPLKNISISINRTADEVYQFTSNPENLPKWASGFVHAVTRQNGHWVGETDFGNVIIDFTAPNSFGILDHQVTLPGGEAVNNPMRVIKNNLGCEVIFTLFWIPSRTVEQFNEDVRLVIGDLQNLKEILEHN
ncbi:MAG: hypothetical protein PHT07_03820 [Paludibacter sp.]|nr:hypothetical protein [Paludibacter sp.]